MTTNLPSRQHLPLRRLLPSPERREHAEQLLQLAHVSSRRADAMHLGGAGWSTFTSTRPAQGDVIQEQRDGLARLRERLFARIRRLEAENASLRRQIERFQGYPSIEEQERERAEAAALEREQAVEFHRLPDSVYPGKPYVTQLDLIRRGVTHYSRQNISRLTRDDKSVPAVQIADRVLLPPSGVRALLKRERLAAADASPRRRPGGSRSIGPE